MVRLSLIASLSLLPSLVHGQKQQLDRLERRPDASTSTAALGVIAAKVMRLWHVNCSIALSDIRVRVFLSPEGALARPPEPLDLDGVTDPAVKAAALRAVAAVSSGAPYEGLPVGDYERWKTFVVRFDGKAACRGQ